MLLVLDDYHLISSDTLQASVRFLLDHRPPQLRVVLASRSDPPLGLARYRGRGELAEVRAADLRFNVDEAAELLRQVSADLDLPSAAALAERTEGWAVGLQLAALSLRTQPDVARFVAAFTGSHRYVLDYLTEEVLGRQREDLRNFLLETSVLERLSGSLCNAVTGRDDSQELLEEVDRSGLFVVQLDDVRGWWRYHHLFADLLRTRLEQDPEHARRLHRNAARWYEQHGLPDGRSGTPWPRESRNGRPGWSKSTSTRSSTCVASKPPSRAGFPRCPRTWFGPALGCCWPRRKWPACAVTCRPWSRFWTRPSG